MFTPATTVCELLSDLNMVFTSFGFCCLTHQCLIPAKELQGHIEKRHPDIAYGKGARVLIATHLLDSHHLTPETPTPEPLAETLTEPIPGVPVSIGFQCPICDAWYNDMPMRDHGYKAHKDRPRVEFNPTKTPLKQRYITRPFWGVLSGTNPERSKAWIFAEGWSPLVTSSTVPVFSVNRTGRSSPSSAPFLAALGWASFIAHLDMDIALDLVKFPSAQLVQHPSSISNRQLEKHLLRLAGLYKRYLFDANHFVASKSDQLIQVLLKGSVILIF